MKHARTEAHSTLTTSHPLPVIAIVGRPNAGKSTLFNRVLRQRKAVVHNTPGVTRDRNFARGTWRSIPFVLIDTGGIDPSEQHGLAGHVQEQTRLAITEADAVIYLLDARAGVSPADAEAVALLRRSGTLAFFAVNKIDVDQHETLAADFFRLGLDTLFSLSAAHGRGVADLLDAVLAPWSTTEEEGTTKQTSTAPAIDEPEVEATLRVAIIGRPNVGKSSLLNRLVGSTRSIVDAMPGTTRDAIDSLIHWQDKAILLVDTAGVRRRPRIHERIEQTSVFIALKALERAEVALLLIDAVEGLTDQDARLIDYAWERGRAVILVINKWDVVPSEQKHQARYLANLHELFAVTLPLPAVFLSALTGAHVSKLLPTVERVAQAHAVQIPTGVLNRHLQTWTRQHPPPSYKGKQPKLFYATQVASQPPVIAIFASMPEAIRPAYVRYLENQLRDTFVLTGTPIKLSFRARRKER